VSADPVDIAPATRRLWLAAEPVHAVAYFAPEPADAARDLGLHGWWMGYFAGRAAPMGAVGPATVTATFFGFQRAMVERALPDAWAIATPEVVLASRLDAMGVALRRTLGPEVDDVAVEVAPLLRTAADACAADTAARPLGAAWAAVPWPDDPVVAMWLGLTALREHRGDGHVLACVHAGLGPLEATVTLVGAGAMPRTRIQPHRGWSDEAWEAAQASLRERRLLDTNARLTAAGRKLRASVEAATERLAAAPAEALGDDGVDQLEAALVPLGRRLVDEDVIPVPNPIGVPRP
jgi:hypothetical protein